MIATNTNHTPSRQEQVMNDTTQTDPMDSPDAMDQGEHIQIDQTELTVACDCGKVVAGTTPAETVAAWVAHIEGADLDAVPAAAPVEFGDDVELYTPADAFNPEEWTPAREIIGATLAEAVAGGITCAYIGGVEHPATRVYDVGAAGWFSFCWLHGRTRTPVAVITGDPRLDARLARGR